MDNKRERIADPIYQFPDQSALFKASALWANAFYKSKCPSACVSICPSVCLLTFEVPFNGLLAPTYQSWMSNIFRDSESLGKSNGRNGLTFEHFCLEVV